MTVPEANAEVEGKLYTASELANRMIKVQIGGGKGSSNPFARINDERYHLLLI